jgi:hypothetical protein
VFNGVVPDGETLVIDQDTGATLDGRDVTPWLVVYRGGMYDHVDADGAPFAVGDEQRLEPFGAAGRAGEPPPWARPRALLPRPPLGRTTWHFSVGQGVYDADDFGEAVLDPPEAPVGRFDEDPPLDACVYDVPASGHVGALATPAPARASTSTPCASSRAATRTSCNSTRRWRDRHAIP